MAMYKIADLNTEMNPKHKTLLEQGRLYITKDDINADIKINISDLRLNKMQSENPNLSADVCEYILFGADFYRNLLKYNGMVLHASAILFEGQAYLFSAPCGTGKSTHAGLWKEYFGNENVEIINDDKPAIRIVNNTVMVYGTPFSGKTNLNSNISAPLGGICVLKQGNCNKIKKLSTEKAVFALLGQTIRRVGNSDMENLMKIIEKILKQISVFEMECTVSTEAVKLAYDTMKKINNQKNSDDNILP